MFEEVIMHIYLKVHTPAPVYKKIDQPHPHYRDGVWTFKDIWFTSRNTIKEIGGMPPTASFRSGSLISSNSATIRWGQKGFSKVFWIKNVSIIEQF